MMPRQQAWQYSLLGTSSSVRENENEINLEEPMDYSNRQIFNSVWVVAQLLCVLNVILVLLWTLEYLGGFAWQDEPKLEFNYHPLFAVLGLIVLQGTGILMYRTLRFHQKMRLKIIHGALLGGGFAASVFSMKTVFDSHDYRPIPIANLYSLHSWIGLGTLILFAAQLCVGFGTYLYPGARSPFRRRYMPLHQFLGMATFALSVASCQSGITEKAKGSLKKDYQLLPPPALIANFLGVSITLYGILVLYLVARPQFKRRSLPEEDSLNLEIQNASVQ